MSRLHGNVFKYGDNINTDLISKNGINSMRHQVVFNYDIQLFKGFSQNISYRYAERTSRISYNVYDLNTTFRTKNVEINMLIQNIFNTEYFVYKFLAKSLSFLDG